MSDKSIRKELPCGTIEYRLNGELLHREDGPAVEFPGGTKRWYLNGKLHREDGPAVEVSNGTKCWYRNGECHREDGPAVEWSHGTKYWYLNGKLHRGDGPAIEHYNGSKWWFLNSKRLSKQAWIEKMWDSFTEEQQEELIFNGFCWTDEVARLSGE